MQDTRIIRSHFAFYSYISSHYALRMARSLQSFILTSLSFQSMGQTMYNKNNAILSITGIEYLESCPKFFTIEPRLFVVCNLFI